VDVIAKENEIVVKAEIPGMEQKDIDVHLEDNQLTIKGERKFEKEDKVKIIFVRKEFTVLSTGPLP
jgi:HSP20 family protein